MWLARAGDRVGNTVLIGGAHHAGGLAGRDDDSETGADTAYGDLCDHGDADLSLACR